MNKALLFCLLYLPISVSHGANAIYRNAVLADNPIVYYEFDEVGGPTATDTTTSVNGTYTGSIGYSAASGAANLGSAIDFTGGYVDLGPASLGTFPQSTVETWIRLDTAIPGCCTSIISSNTWNTGALHLNLIGGNNIEHAVNADALVPVRTTIGLATGTWYHLVTTNDNVLNETNIYLNGVLVADTGDHSTQDVVYGFGGGNQIGAWNGARLFDGRMDEFAIYDSVLSASDVANHFAAASVPEPSGALLVLLGGALAVARRRR